MKIKNDQSSYIRRSDLPLCPKKGYEVPSEADREQREREFLAAKIDEFGYFDFGAKQ